MSQTTHQIKVKGVDQTAPAFGSIKNRAAATGAQIRSMLGGAIAAAGAYLGLRSIKGGIDQLGHLSDVAMRTSTSVDELTRTASALSALGISGMGVDQLAKSFDYMAKTTGRTGMEGFFQTIDELGKIDDVATRGEMAMKVFGKSGMAFIPLINAADRSVGALRNVIAAMPSIPQAAADAGDAASDAMGFAANQVQSIWLQGLSFLANKLNNDYTGDVRTAALTAGNWLEYYTKVAVAKCITWYSKLQSALRPYGEAIGTFFGAAAEKLFGSGGTWSDVFKQTAEAWKGGLREYADDAAELDATEEARVKRFRANYEKREAAIRHFARAYKAAAISTADRTAKNDVSGIAGLDAAMKAPAVRNELVLAGNEANRMALLGPQLQNETKKQTDLLTKIAENTSQTARNTEEAAADEPGEWNG